MTIHHLHHLSHLQHLHHTSTAMASEAGQIDPCVSTKKGPSLEGQTISVLVGKDESEFNVHEELICGGSPFFRNAMKKEWAAMRSEARKIRLPDHDPRTFRIYMQWLYCKQLPVRNDNLPHSIKTIVWEYES